MAVRIRPEEVVTTLAALETTWNALAPEQPFVFSFLDDNVDALYQADERTGRLFGSFALLAIGIACLGLFGLAAYMAELRTKEIGVRKVLGATIPGVLLLLTKDFARLVLIALVVATPVAYVAMQRWLAGFAYHMDLSWPIFVLAGLVALGVALLTVTYQSYRAAYADPVESLRYE
jgi:putative ABC transport system permease protein